MHAIRNDISKCAELLHHPGTPLINCSYEDGPAANRRHVTEGCASLSDLPRNSSRWRLAKSRCEFSQIPRVRQHAADKAELLSHWY